MIYYIARTYGMVEIKRTVAPLTLKELQEIVGGNIEFAESKNGLTVCVNEDGIGYGPINPFKLEMFHQNQFWGDIIIGKTVETSEDRKFVGFEENEESYRLLFNT